MTLEPTRAGAYLAGALAGGFTAATVVVLRRRALGTALRTLVAAVACGAAAVGLEEWTRTRAEARGR